jgi:iron-sulfur cluster assembly accessory protein
MIRLTDNAVSKVKEVIAEQADNYAGIRVAVVGGGCSGFQYAMNLERGSREGDEVLELDGLKVFVDDQSALYLNGTEIDYIETVQGAGFKFSNPNARNTCGCGESFHV